MNRIIKNLITITCTVIVLGACKSEPSTTADTPDVAVDVTANVTADIGKAHITVYKSASCGCCKEWVTYLEEEGFAVTAINHDNVDEIKTKYGLPDAGLKSCHTAIVDGYIVEGHVPANDIERLLSERPKGMLGLSAPGMPMMSPGMGSRTPKDYAVIAFTPTGETSVYSQY